MSVSPQVQDLLDLQNINYQITASPLSDDVWYETNPSEIHVRSIILKDGLGKVLVLFSQDSLLDLSDLNQQLVRDLRMATPEDVGPILDKHHLDAIPGLPTLLGIPTVVDQRLMNAEKLRLHSGNADLMLEVSQSNFQQIIHDSTVYSVTVPVNSLASGNNADGDEAEILEAVSSFTSLRIKQRLEDTLELPPLPHTAQRIIQLRADPNADISDLANIVETDSSLAAQVVGWAASPYYSAPGKIKSIHDAIVRVLGFDMVLNLSLGLALGKTLNVPTDNPLGIMPYWQQSVYTAAAVEGLVTAIPREKRPSFGMAYLSGLLHNFGYLILAEVFPPYLEKINRHIEVNQHVPAGLIEKHLIGINRDQLASWLTRSWNLPDEVVVGLRYQNQPGYDGEFSDYSRLLYTAQAKLRERSIGGGPLLTIGDDLYKALSLDPEQADITINNIMDSTEELGHIAQQMAS